MKAELKSEMNTLVMRTFLHCVLLHRFYLLLWYRYTTLVVRVFSSPKKCSVTVLISGMTSFRIPEDPKFQLKETNLQFDVNGKGNLMNLP